MSGLRVQKYLLACLGMATLFISGCSDFDVPFSLPFQGPVSDVLPGVTTPAERIEQLQKLAAESASKTPAEHQQISRQLVATIRTEKDPLIRVEIIRTLGEYPGPEADAVLKAALNDADIHVRLAACEAWGKRSDAETVQLLSEVLRSDVDADVRLAAAKALGNCKNPAAVPALGNALNDGDPAMQYRAMLSLKNVTGKDLGNNVERWQHYVKGETPTDTPSLAERMGQWF